MLRTFILLKINILSFGLSFSCLFVYQLRPLQTGILPKCPANKSPVKKDPRKKVRFIYYRFSLSFVGDFIKLGQLGHLILLFFSISHYRNLIFITYML